MQTDPPTAQSTEHVDVLIVGAGISGIGAARYLRTLLPHKSFTILEARASLGGTWDLFRYPGIRSDSDLHTFGYEFKPWRDEESIADGDRILAYLRETATENGLDGHIRYHHRVTGASWSSADARWTVTVERDGERFEMTAGWLFCAGGYYNYDEGYTPVFEGRDRFGGTIVHPQHWPEDLDYRGKRVVVIGSGATAVTLVPAMADTAGHITMLQRTPTYILPIPKKDPIANRLRRLLGDERGYAWARRKNIAQQRLVWSLCQKYPDTARRIIRRLNADRLPAGYPVDEHFNPPYNPWDQRLCTVPNGDLFKSIREGKAEMVTDRIATFTETGIRLESGRELEADIIITATGLNLQTFGGLDLTVDGRTVELSETVAYKGLMLSGVPNLAYAIGYTNSSWTLKIGLLCEHFCRLLTHMDAHGNRMVCAEPADPDMPRRPLLDFGAGYIQRSVAQLPSQGDRKPWLTSMNYQDDARMLRGAPVLDPELHFDRAPAANRRRSAAVHA